MSAMMNINASLSSKLSTSSSNNSVISSLPTGTPQFSPMSSMNSSNASQIHQQQLSISAVVNNPNTLVAAPSTTPFIGGSNSIGTLSSGLVPAPLLPQSFYSNNASTPAAAAPGGGGGSGTNTWYQCRPVWIDKAMQDIIKVPHTFIVRTYKTPTICQYCKKLLKGIYKQGFQCKGPHF